MSQSRRKRASLAIAGALAAALLVISAPLSASAINLNGSKICSGKFGWLLSQTTGSTGSTPPGSAISYYWGAGGTHDVVAEDVNGFSKSGGGNWYLFAGSVSTATATCKSFG